MLSTLRKPRYKAFVSNLDRHSRPCRLRSFGTTGPKNNYESTLPNLRIGRHTRVIFQGFTGESMGSRPTRALTNNDNR